MPLAVMDLSLAGGMVTDGEDIELPIQETTNLVKPIGGNGKGFQTRPGIAYYDILSTVIIGQPTTAGYGRIHACKLLESEGYPPGSYLMVYQRNSDQAILETFLYIPTLPNTVGPNEIEPPDPYTAGPPQQ